MKKIVNISYFYKLIKKEILWQKKIIRLACLKPVQVW